MNDGGATLPETIELVVVEHDTTRVRALAASGARTFLVDWEYRHKDARQQGFDTEIRPGTPADLSAVTAVPDVSAWCRINALHPGTLAEVDSAIAGGAAGIFLPMVVAPSEVERLLELVNDRASVGILVETVAALAAIRELATLPLDRVYFGLNDFAISRGGGSIFRALIDGSVEQAREAFAGTAFGVAGLTAPDGGCPIPCRRLIQEMARLDCTFSFLRRSFFRDLATRRADAMIAGIHDAWRESIARDAATVAGDHAALCEIVRELN